MVNVRRLFILAFSFIVSSGVLAQSLQYETPQARGHVRVIETLYGDFKVHEPVLLDLIDSPAVQRMKGIRQYGVLYFVDPKEYTRYVHSIGVWALLRRYGASLEEQIAGLLHDVSHTVFSHVGDVVFNNRSLKSSYQDDIHAWSLEQQGVSEILAKHGMKLESILHKNDHFKMLEQDLPDLCIDRIEYNIYGGLLENMITKEDIEPILEVLTFENGRWFFTDKARAKQFSLISLYHTEYVWGGLCDFVTYRFAAHALRRAVEIGLLTFDDIHFSVDDIVWQKLCSCGDLIIKKDLEGLMQYEKSFVIGTSDNYNLIVKTKFRGVNPWVRCGDSFKRLTESDDDYLCEYNRVKTTVTQGIKIQGTQEFLDKSALQNAQLAVS